MPALTKGEIGLLLSNTLPLLDVIYKLEETTPADAREAWMIRAVAPPDEDRLAHDVVFWHKSPIT